MAIYRTIQISFWDKDTKVMDDFTPEDKYFYLYLLTNPHTNLAGCYEISLKNMSNELGYTTDTVERLINRFQNVHKVIIYFKETKEILMLNWNKYNWTSSPKFLTALEKEVGLIKNKEAKKYVVGLMNGEKDTVSIPYAYPMDTSVTVTNTINNNINNSFNNIKNNNYIDNTNSIKEIIDYLNSILGTKYSPKTKDTVKHINARLEEGYTVEDFKTVIDKKYADWHNKKDMVGYLRPETLFGTKFESYLNQKEAKTQTENAFDVVDSWLQRRRAEENP